MASGLYYEGILACFKGQIDVENDNFKCMVCTSAYAPNPSSHVFRSSVTNELSPAGSYSAGGAAVNISVSRSGNVITFSIPDTVFASVPAGQSGRRAVIYQDTGNAATDRLLLCIDNGSDAPTNGTAYTVSVTVAPTVTVATWS